MTVIGATIHAVRPLRAAYANRSRSMSSVTQTAHALARHIVPFRGKRDVRFLRERARTRTVIE
jgi:hypothetical protein